jgi:RNA polymerase sigma factor (sigma-70 family)
MRRRTPLTPEQRDLAARYVPFARHVARPLKLAWPGLRHQLDSAALLALCESAARFDPAVGVKFATYARFRIMGSLRDALRVACREAHAVGAVAPADPAGHWIPRRDELDRLMLVSREPDPSAPTAADDELAAWLAPLPAAHAAAVRALYVEGSTQADHARAARLSKTRVSQIHAEALDLLADSSRVRRAALEAGHLVPPEEMPCSC